MTLIEAAARANELVVAGDERALADLRREWDDEVEAAARNSDYRVRAVAYRAIGQFRYRQKLELLSRDAPGPVNQSRRLLHELASHDGNDAVRRLAIICLKNGSPARETVVLLAGLAQEDDESRDLRDAAQKVAAQLTKKSRTR